MEHPGPLRPWLLRLRSLATMPVCVPLWVLLPAIASTAGTLSDPTTAPTTTRDREIATCEMGENVTWPDGRDSPAVGGAVRLVYRHAGAPSWFNEALVLGTVQRAVAAWSACGVPAEVISEDAALINRATVVVVQWNEAETRGNFALANLTRRTLSLSANVFQLLAQRTQRPALQAHYLQMAISHEVGHFFGLQAHSRRCVDVMSYYTGAHGETCTTRDGSSYKTQGEYRAVLPTACDIARCRMVNKTPP